MKKLIKSDWTAIILGFVIMFALFAVSPRESVQNVIGGIGIMLWVILWTLRKYAFKE